MQNAAIAALGLNWVYVALPVNPERLTEAIRGAAALGMVGLNVTIPHKQAVLPLMDRVDPAALAIGAINTIHFDGGEVVGYNTDVYGYRATVEQEGDFDFLGRSVLQLGAGGVGRAMAAGAAEAGAQRVMIHARNPARAAELTTELSEHYPSVTFEALGSADALREAAAAADLIANATPLGMKRGDDFPLPPQYIDARHVVFDTVYTPAETPLLREAARRGARCVPGLGMLARQGARALEAWSGRKPDERLMLETLRNALATRSEAPH